MEPSASKDGLIRGGASMMAGMMEKACPQRPFSQQHQLVLCFRHTPCFACSGMNTSAYINAVRKVPRLKSIRPYRG